MSRQNHRLPGVIYILAAGTFLMGTTEFLVAGLLPQIAEGVGVDVARAGLSITVFAIGMVVGTPLMAIITLRFPRRTTLVLALVVFAVGHVAAAVSTSLPFLLSARFVTALATGAFWAVAAVVAARIAGPSSAARALTIVLGGGMLANILGVPLGSFAGQLLGWRGPFLALAVLALIAAVVIARSIKPEHEDPVLSTIGAEIRAFRSPRLLLTLLTCTLVNGAVLSVFTFVAPVLTNRTHLPASVVPFVLLLFGLASLIGSLASGRLGDAHPHAVLGLTAVGGAIAMGGLLVFPGNGPATIALFVFLGLTGLSTNAVLVSMAVRFGGAAPTLASASATSAFNLGTAIGSSIASATFESAGPTGPILVGLIAIALMSGPVIGLKVLARRVSENEQPRALAQ